jgi:hypothetical protein
MRPDGGGVQFFDLVEVTWRSDHGPAGAAAASSGCTGGATEGTCTAGRSAGAKVGGGRLARRDNATGRAKRGGSITGTSSGRAGRDDGPRAAWGIMVLES